MIHLGATLLYVLHLKTALRLFKPLTEYELLVLTHLYATNKPVSYRLLQRSVIMKDSTFHYTIKSLVSSGYILSERKGVYRFFSLTPSGRLLLFQFAAALDKIVQEKLKEFGSNDDSL